MEAFFSMKSPFRKPCPDSLPCTTSARSAGARSGLPDGDGSIARGEEEEAGRGEGDRVGQGRTDGNGGLAAGRQVPDLQLRVGSPGVDREARAREASSVGGEGCG